MATDTAPNADVQQMLIRASDLMFEALMLLDRAQSAHVAALLDHAIALLPACRPTGPASRLNEIYSDKSSSIRR